MPTSHRLKRQEKRTSQIFTDSIRKWKSRPIHGFEKHLFANAKMPLNKTISSIKSTHKHKIDPARFIYPRDAMGNLRTSLYNRKNPISIPFYLPKYDFVKVRSPKWTIKNVHQMKATIHHVGTMTYNSSNDKSQLPCKRGWTQIGRHKI